MTTQEKLQQNQPQTSENSFSTGEGQTLAPPVFQLKANPIQMNNGGGGGENEAASGETASADPEINVDSAISFNNGKEFRLDWVRNLQLALTGSRVSTDGTFDEATVRAVARFQAAQGWTGNDVDGKIGENTRRTLEQTHASLLTTVTGDHLDTRVLIPAGASDEQKFAYYRSIIEESGSVFLSGPMQINLLGIRGIKVASAETPVEIGGQTLAPGTIYQTSSAQDFVNARSAGTSDDHMRFSASEGFDDMIISLWTDQDGAIQVRERRGSVDPASNFNTDTFGTGHLRDGQYAYQLGRHGTGSASHKGALRWLQGQEGADSLDIRGSDRMSYAALRPTRNQEVWRNYDGNRRSNDRYINADEERESNERIYQDHNRYMNDNFAINIHTSRNNAGNSVACQNVPADEYIGFMNEIQGADNTGNILYTLIDASKIENGLQMQQQQQDPDLGAAMEALRQIWATLSMMWMF